MEISNFYGIHMYYQIWTAQKMIQQVGVTLPEEIPERHLLELSFKKVKLLKKIFDEFLENN